MHSELKWQKMCGIFALLGKIARTNLAKAVECAERIKHRGPDSTTYHIRDNVFLCFHRLAINDTSIKGDQPFKLGHAMLICNGEIYNAHELAIKHEIELQSGSDCEVIIHMIAKLGIKQTLQELNGYFAFVYVDTETGTWHAARDAFGVRPLYYDVQPEKGAQFTSELKSTFPGFHLKQFPHAQYCTGSLTDDDVTFEKYYEFVYPKPQFVSAHSEDWYLLGIQNRLTEAVVSRILLLDRPFGFFLSGGTDSSVICGIAAKYLREKCGIKINTFSIGLPGATDLLAARKVARYIESDHHEYVVSETEMLSFQKQVVQQLESWDITTIRASTPMMLLAKKIREDPKTKHIVVMISGEGSDEASGSYLYFHNAPSPSAFHEERVRLVEDLQYFDNQRSDKCMSKYGFEGRFPFLDRIFIDFYMSIPPELMIPRDGVEKYMLRKAFDGLELIPHEILWRRKEAFSDGVSTVERSWQTVISEHVKTHVSQEQLELCTYLPKPQTLEALYYRIMFNSFYPGCDDVHPYYWLPRWSGDVTDPSARVLAVYSTS